MRRKIMSPITASARGGSKALESAGYKKPPASHLHDSRKAAGAGSGRGRNQVKPAEVTARGARRSVTKPLRQVDETILKPALAIRRSL
jgi:hypothetical protein